MVHVRAGASGGIGEACAWRFAEAGCRLVLLARRAEKLEELKQKLQAEYKVLKALKCQSRGVTLYPSLRRPAALWTCWIGSPCRG